MLEIYKESLSDLLSVNKTDLRIKESPLKGIYVEGLTSIVIFKNSSKKIKNIYTLKNVSTE